MNDRIIELFSLTEWMGVASQSLLAPSPLDEVIFTRHWRIEFAGRYRGQSSRLDGWIASDWLMQSYDSSDKQKRKEMTSREQGKPVWKPSLREPFSHNLSAVRTISSWERERMHSVCKNVSKFPQQIVILFVNMSTAQYCSTVLN